MNLQTILSADNVNAVIIIVAVALGGWFLYEWLATRKAKLQAKIKLAEIQNEQRNN